MRKWPFPYYQYGFYCQKFRKWDVLPKVEGVKAIPTDEKSQRHILYQTTSQAYGQVSLTTVLYLYSE